jgi:hypothetical protein
MLTLHNVQCDNSSNSVSHCAPLTQMSEMFVSNNLIAYLNPISKYTENS